jgi:hypothetical protein
MSMTRLLFVCLLSALLWLLLLSTNYGTIRSSARISFRPGTTTSELTPIEEQTGHESTADEISGVRGKDVLLLVGWDGNSHREIDGIELMVRENREQYAAHHGIHPLQHLIYF